MKWQFFVLLSEGRVCGNWQNLTSYKPRTMTQGVSGMTVTHTSALLVHLDSWHLRCRSVSLTSCSQIVSPVIYLPVDERSFFYSGEQNDLIHCWFCTSAHWQRNGQSIIFMVMFIWTVRQNNNKKSRKMQYIFFYKLICILTLQNMT